MLDDAWAAVVRASAFVRPVPDDQHYVDRAIDDPDRHPRALARGGTGDSVAAEGRRDIHEFRDDDLRPAQRTEAHRRTLRLAAGGNGSVADVRVQSPVFGQQSFFRSE